MDTIQRTVRSPALRLKWLETISPPFRRETPGSHYLVAVGLGLMLATLVGVGIAIGIFGTEPIAQYLKLVLELAWPGTH